LPKDGPNVSKYFPKKILKIMGLTLLSQWISRRKNANKNHNKPTNYHRMVYNKTKINKYFNIQLKLYRNCITLPRDNDLTIHQFASKQKNRLVHDLPMKIRTRQLLFGIFLLERSSDGVSRSSGIGTPIVY